MPLSSRPTIRPTPPPLAESPDASLDTSAQPSRIVIPAIGLDARVIEVGWKTVQKDGKLINVWETADNAVGYHRYSAYPGQGGNTVLAGHHDIKGQVFRYLVDLEPGDRIVLYAGGEEYRYAVEGKYIVQEAGASEERRRENARWIAPTPDERLTLVTCWPYRSSTHRLIVVAKPVTR